MRISVLGRRGRVGLDLSDGLEIVGRHGWFTRSHRLTTSRRYCEVATPPENASSRDMINENFRDVQKLSVHGGREGLMNLMNGWMNAVRSEEC